MNETVKAIPHLPGIYVFKDSLGVIIYIGKAKDLKKRVMTYFHRKNEDWKIQELIKAHRTVEHIITKSEVEALLLEAQLIKKFKPKYNVLLKTGNPFIYITIIDEPIPKLELRTKKSKTGAYFGPFIYKQKVRRVYEYLLRTFALRLCSIKIGQGCLDYHLGRCAGNCLDAFDLQAYTMRIEVVKKLLEGDYESCKGMLFEQIKYHNERMEFEKSRHITEYVTNLESIFHTLQAGFSETKYIKDITVITTPLQYKVQKPLKALEDLQILLKLDKKPITIDCFDISHFQSSYLVGSCIRFTHGIPDKPKFRRFKIKTLIEQNDYAALQEITLRRYRDFKDLPDVVLIDGGKGQLSSVAGLFRGTMCVSLAKREELLFTPYHPEGYKLDVRTDLGQLLISLRDYAHHFAISYHKLLRNNQFKEV